MALGLSIPTLLAPDCPVTSCWPPPQAADMSSLQELCSGLPLQPLPENRGRWAGVPHAPVRTPGLSPAEEQVTAATLSSRALGPFDVF